MALEDPETQALYSILPERLCREVRFSGLKNLTAREALGLTLILLTKPTPLGFLVLDEIGQLCRKNKYQGTWMDVHHILKVNFPDLVLYTLLERGYSFRDVFGNILKLGRVALCNVKILSQEIRLPVKKPQRKRGYDDHGSRRPEDKWLPSDIHLGANPDVLDLSASYKKKRAILNFLYS